jgi:hypothetical protein
MDILDHGLKLSLVILDDPATEDGGLRSLAAVCQGEQKYARVMLPFPKRADLSSCPIIFILKLSTGKLGRKNVKLLDHRRLREKLGSPRHQRRCDAARKVCLPARLIREGVKDAERRRPKADPKPRSRSRFFLYHRKTSAKEVLDVFFFSSLRDWHSFAVCSQGFYLR